MISLNNFQRILIKFGIWLGTGILICLVGISGVFAATYDVKSFTAQLYDNYGPNLSPVSTVSTEANYYGILQLVANSSGGAWGISSPTPLLANHTYTLTAEIYPSDCGSLVLSSYNRIGIGSTLDNARTSYQNNTNVNEIYSKVVSSNLIQFAFTTTINSSYIIFPFATNQSCSSSQIFLASISFDDLGSKSLTQDEINNSLTNQTNILNANINAIGQDTSTIINQNNQLNDNINAVGQDTSTIINQNNNLLDVENQNKQDIIDNQNENTDKEIESQKVCIDIRIDREYIFIDNSVLGSDGRISSNSSYGITDYIPFESDIKVLENGTGGVYSCFYNSNYSLTGCILNRNILSNVPIEVPDNSVFIRLTIYKSSNRPIIQLKSCKNGNQALNDNLNDLNSNLTDSSPIDMGSLGDTAGWLPAGPIDSIINLPLNFLNSLLSAMNKTCSPLSVPVPYIDTRIEIPCISTIFNKITGVPSLWNWVGTIASVVILYRYLLALYKYYDDLTTLKANFISDFGGAP